MYYCAFNKCASRANFVASERAKWQSGTNGVALDDFVRAWTLRGNVKKLSRVRVLSARVRVRVRICSMYAFNSRSTDRG